MADSKKKRVAGVPKAKLKKREEAVVEVFPTTAQLSVALAVAVIVLVGLVYLDLTQAKNETASVEAAKIAKANYFNTIWGEEFSKYESNIALPRIRAAVLKYTTPSDGARVKLARSCELAQSSKLAAVYPVLQDPERKLVRSSLSDWKLSRLLTLMQPLEAQKLVTELNADYAEMLAAEESQAAASSAESTSGGTQVATAGADMGSGAIATTGGGQQPAAGAGSGAMTAGQILGVVSPSGAGTTTGP